MQHSPRAAEFPKMLLDCVSKLHEKCLVPLVIPPETTSFLHELGIQCDSALKPLGQFLLGIQPLQIEESILVTILPNEYWAYCKEIEEREVELSEAVANNDFSRAVVIRDAMRGIKSQLAQIFDIPIEVKPVHLQQAIANLGYSKTISI